MATYRCPECHEYTDQPTCPQCVVAAKPVTDEAPPPPPEAPPDERPQAGPALTIPIEAVVAEDQQPRDEPEEASEDLWSRADAAWRRQVPQSSPEPILDLPLNRTQELPAAPEVPPQPRPSAADSPPDASLVGQEQVQADLADGYEIYMAIGTYFGGKSQLLEAFESLTPGYLDRFDRVDGMVTATTPDTVTSHRISAAGRKMSFIDIAGENFALPLRVARSTDALSHAIAGHRLVAEVCAGVVLVIDIQTLWDATATHVPEWRQQIEVAAWNLEILRWLRFDGVYPENCPIPLGEYIDRQVRKLKQRLDFPVLVLFSKSDQLAGKRIEGTGRPVVPVGENPLFFAYHCFPNLHGALLRHANHFRYDFVHSIVTDPDTGVVVAGAPPCGVDLSFAWLLDPVWRRPLPKIPTRFWLQLQRLVDRMTLRGRRWHRLQRPRRLVR